MLPFICLDYLIYLWILIGSIAGVILATIALAIYPFVCYCISFYFIKLFFLQAKT
jgi:hypothetical protein